LRAYVFEVDLVIDANLGLHSIGQQCALTVVDHVLVLEHVVFEND